MILLEKLSKKATLLYDHKRGLIIKKQDQIITITLYNNGYYIINGSFNNNRLDQYINNNLDQIIKLFRS
jgi:ArsR family metal-binding transcriptional regulator